jgi:exonuclease SbcD
VPKILHFADAHIDMANYGRHDAQTGLPMRVMDFLRSLDTIVDAAIAEKVELALFAGDAYKDRNPAPTFQREWGKRIMRLSNAGIQSILLVGNHDLSPGLGRANALETFNTLEVPRVHVIDKPSMLTPEDLGGVNVQVMALPWISRSGMMAYFDMSGLEPAEVYAQLEERIGERIDLWVDQMDPDLPTILTAHASIQGAEFGGERTVMLGADLVLAPALVKNDKFDYVALGHIHKAQDLNEGGQPPVVYPGSIERVDFGEAKDKKYYVLADVERGKKVTPDWRELKDIRKFIDIPSIKLMSEKNVTERIRKAMPTAEEMEGAIVRLTLEYPREWETLIDDAALREMTALAFEFHYVKRPQMETRIRIPEDKTVGSLTPRELLDIYWKSTHVEEAEREELLALAEKVIEEIMDEE